MDIKKTNIVSGGFYLDGEITVECSTKEYEYLLGLWSSQKPGKGLLSEFGYEGALIVVDKNVFVANDKMLTTFSLKAV